MRKLSDKMNKNPKRFYKYIKSKRINRERIDPLKDECGHLCVEPQRFWQGHKFSSVCIATKAMEAKELKE